MVTLYDKWWREKMISFVTNLNVFYCKNNKMVRTCSVPGCRSESYSGCNISFYSFPKNENIKIKWQKNLNITRPITKFSKVCSLHFDPTSFYTPNSLRLLKKDAIPIPAVPVFHQPIMAGVKSLSVRGIRSFGPDDADEQRITFDKPLTLILGQNGCGKTTIIECLRYAVTGQMPPGSRNECFVHDAKVNRTTEVLGQVKLKIVNAKDKHLEVSRSMKVTTMKNKTKFQTLESYLSTVDENGKPKDISSRCADLDFIMNEELGVSKAILNYVIFCHQEDSAWPLDEGKKVKERFDEIFDADKYSDCFERFRKIRKEYANTLNLLAQEVSFLTEKKQDLDKKKLEVINTETRISEAEIKVSELSNELKPVSEKLAIIKALENDLLSLETQKEKIRVRLEHCQTQETELKTNIKELFEGTREELQQKISNYEEEHKSKKKELDESVKKNKALTKEDDSINKEKNSNDIKYNKFTLLESQNQEKIDNKYKMIVDAAQLAEIEGITELSNNEDADKAKETVSEKIKTLKQELTDQKTEADAEEKKMQAFVDESRDDLSRHKQKISSKETEIHKNKRELTKLEKEINSTNESKTRLEALEAKLAEAETEYTTAEKELSAEECQQEINDDEKVIEKHEKDLEELSAKVTKLQKQTAKLKERDMIEGMLKSKEKELAVLMNKHKVALTEILGSVPEKDFAVSVNKFECDIRAQVDGLKKKLKEKNTECTKLETERKHIRELLSERRSELTKAEDKMYKACGTNTYDATLAKYTSTVEKLQDEQNVLQSSMYIFAKYKTQLKDNNCCPLCSRGFENETEVSDLISQLTTQVMNVPSKLEKVTEDLQKNSAKKDELLAMKSVNEKIIKLKEKDIPEMETRLNDTDAKIKACTESIEELQMALIEPEQKMQTAKQIHGDMPLLDRYQADYKTISKNLENLKALCADMESDMTLDEATAKQTDLRTKLSTLRNRVKNSQKKLNLYNKKLQTLGDKKNKIKEELLNVQKKVQDLVNLQETKKQLEADRERLLKELQELQDGLAPLQEALKGKQEAKNETVKKYRALVDTKNAFITKVVNAFDKVKAIEQEIKQHLEKNIPREMEKLKEANEKLAERQKQIADEKAELALKMDALKDEISKQELYKRDLKDNMKLRDTQAEIEKCQKDETEVAEKLNGINRDQLSEKEGLITQQTKLFREKAQTEGSLDELKRHLRTAKTELAKALAKDIEKKYKEKVYELYVTKAIDKDIKDYAVALEKCLMEFHKEKMENINLIIRELWRKIYRGNDIDYIEIKTEGSVSTESDRRKYDYRVVQCKNGVEIDMRGRCSAGQKVLACLIIRLALAETFSSRFGILALDEPTTNLDEENVRSLCSALGEIVQDRMRQKNFMFIIITHDRDFIDTLGNIDKVSHYYEVSRNDDGKSRIKRVKFV